MFNRIIDEDYPENPNVTEADMKPLMVDYRCIYGMNINLERSFPSIADGLKPVMRRIMYMIYTKYGLNKFKVGTMVGIVLTIHPHGDQGMGGTFARMAQDFANNIPLLSTLETGNSGNATSGDDYASPRYLDMKMSKFAYDILFDEFDNKVNMKQSSSPDILEPITLPSKFPIVLLNGTSGIGWTMSSDIPPYNLNEIADATIKLLKNPDAKVHLVPDSPTGCDIIILDTGNFMFQSSFEVDNMNYQIIFKNTPYMKFFDDIDAKLCELQKGPHAISEIIDANDDSNLIEGKLRYVIQCKPCNLYNVINKLFKLVPGFRSQIPTSNMHVVDTNLTTKVYDERQILCAWIKHRIFEKRGFFQRKLVRYNAEKNQLTGKAFMLNGKNLHTTISIIEKSKSDKEGIINELVKAFKPHVTTSQAKIVAESPMYKISAKEYNATVERLKAVEADIDYARHAISSEETIKQIIIDELTEIKKTYGYPRRSKILNGGSNNNADKNIGYVEIESNGSIMFSETSDPNFISSDIIPISGDEVCCIDDKARFLWVDVNKVPHEKQITLTSIGRSQMSGCLHVVSNVDHNVALLTNMGRIKVIPIERFPSNSSKKPLMPLSPGENIVSILELLPNDSNPDILIYTKNGLGKKIASSDLNVQKTVESSGQTIIDSSSDDEVCGMFFIDPKKPFLLYVAKSGKIRLNHSKFLTTSKKYSKPFPILTLTERDSLFSVACVTKTNTVKLYHADSRISTINIDSMEPSTMQAPLKRPKHVPGVPIARVVIK